MHRIILADNQSIFRTGAAKVLSGDSTFYIIAQCGDVDRLHRSILAYPDATVLFSSSLKQEPRLVMQRISENGSRGIAVLENGELEHAYLAAQVHGVFFRSIPAVSLIEGVRRVARGGRAFPTRATMLEPDEDLVGTRMRDRLTQKELKIVALIAQGNRNKAIALQLHTTEQVVKNSLRGVYSKTGVSDRLELALFMMQHRTFSEAVAAAGRLLLAHN